MTPAMAARVRVVLAPAIFFALVVALWQASVFNDLFGIERFAVPLPDEILSAAADESGELSSAFGQTFAAVVLGYALGNSVGFVLALGLLRLPDAIAQRAGAVGASVQALPIVATAPLISLWVENPTWFKASVVTVMSFPSMLVFAYRGMTSIDPRALELAASYDASRWQVLTALRLPTAIPHIFTALKYTVVLALVGVVVSEILVSQDGLGILIEDSLQKFNTPEAWAAVGILGLTGVGMYVALVGLERGLFPWAARHGPQQS